MYVLSPFLISHPVTGNIPPMLGRSPELLGGPGLLCRQQGGIGRPKFYDSMTLKYLVFEIYEQNALMWVFSCSCFLFFAFLPLFFLL